MWAETPETGNVLLFRFANRQFRTISDAEPPLHVDLSSIHNSPIETERWHVTMPPVGPIQFNLKQKDIMSKELFDLSDDVAVVIGGTGVLGGGMAEALAAAGAKVAILGRSEERGAARVKAIEDAGDGPCSMPLTLWMKTP